MSAVIALNRFALYEHMHMPLPSTTASERRRVMNKDLVNLLKYKKGVSLIYRHPN